jgi:single-strand DNA-binding protein
MRGKRAETIDKYFKKGMPIDVEGRLELNSWEKDGQKHYKMRVVIENWEFVSFGGKKDSSSSDGDTAQSEENLEDETIPF